MQNEQMLNDIHTFWNSRAALGREAGSRDVILKQLEIEAIAKFIKDNIRILEIGCGNGITALEMVRRYQVDLTAIDFAEDMISAAKELTQNQDCRGSVKFQVGNVLALTGFTGKFDLIYTERTLINLPDWPTQKRALINITELLADDGLYVMCESSQNGLENINNLRSLMELSAIVPPWHNRYFKEEELAQVVIPGVKLEEVIDFSSTYYFLSRIINAALATQQGVEPEYDAPINKLSLRLPAFGDLGQTKLWLWRKQPE